MRQVLGSALLLVAGLVALVGWRRGLGGYPSTGFYVVGACLGLVAVLLILAPRLTRWTLRRGGQP